MTKKRNTGAAAGATAVKGMATSEEDLTAAVDGMDELELVMDAVAQFEQNSFETKKRINAMDRLAYKSQLLPPTLRLCYQALQKSWKQDAK